MIRLIRAAVNLLSGRPSAKAQPETQDDFHAAMQRWSILLQERPK